MVSSLSTGIIFYHHVAIKELGHFLTRPGLTRQSRSLFSGLPWFLLPFGVSFFIMWVICYVAFDLHVVSNFKVRPDFSCETFQWLKCPQGPGQGKSSGRIATFSLWTGWHFLHFWWNSYTAVTRSSLPRLWEQGIPREDEDDCWVGEAIVLRVTTPCTLG
jgi:hypothetical protein